MDPDNYNYGQAELFDPKPIQESRITSLANEHIAVEILYKWFRYYEETGATYNPAGPRNLFGTYKSHMGFTVEGTEVS